MLKDHKSNVVIKTVNMLLLVLMVALFSGCATKSATVGPVFFPPPPDEPHVQFLTGVTTSGDFNQSKSGLMDLLVGGTETITKLAKPYGIIAHKGKLYICDVGASQIVVVDFAQKTMNNLINETGSGQLKKPIDVAVDDDDYVYVADNGRKDIAVYNPAGKFVKSYSTGFPHESLIGVAIYQDQLLVLDNIMGKVFLLDRKTGEVLSSIGESGDRTQNLALPNGMTVDSKGNIHVVNVGNGKVKEYDRDGHMLSEFGKLGDFPGEFTRPRGIAVDADGWIFVVDAGHQVVEVFNEKHRILGSFGQPGLMAGSMNLPAGIAVSKDNLDLFQKYAAPGFKLQEIIYVTNQYYTSINHALAVYGLGAMEGAKERAAAQEKKDANDKKLKAKDNKPVKP